MFSARQLRGIPSIFIITILVIPCACSHPPAYAPTRGRSLDDLFANIVRTDWQTEYQWGPSPNPSKEFLDQVWEGAEFRPLDLDGDGRSELILCLNFSPGQKPINQTFYILRRVSGGWILLAQFEGQPELASDASHFRGMKPIVTTCYDGGFQYSSTRYEFRDGRYLPVAT